MPSTDHFGPERLFFQLAHDLVFRFPGLLPLRRYGTIPANQENAMAALGRGAALLVYPGGDIETYRPSWHSGEIDFGHRTGFIQLALQADVPIVPVVAVGGQETALFLTRGERLAHLLFLDRLLRLDVVPIQIAPPFGLTRARSAGKSPAPLSDHDPGPASDRAAPALRLRPRRRGRLSRLTAMMQEELDELSAERDLPVIGVLGHRHEESEVVEDLRHGGLKREVDEAIEGERPPFDRPEGQA